MCFPTFIVTSNRTFQYGNYQILAANTLSFKRYNATHYIVIIAMAPTTFHSYQNEYGDTITFKFDPDIARNPDPNWPNDSAVTVYHSFSSDRLLTSILLSMEAAMKCWRNDNQAAQPPIGKVMYTEYSVPEDGSGVRQRAQYIWRGWNHGEGYRRGWTKLYVSEPRISKPSKGLPLSRRS